MVLYVVKVDISPDKAEAYMAWAPDAMNRNLAVPGVVEFRGYRGVASPPPGQVVVTYEFADLQAWAAWYAHEDIQKSATELRGYAANVSAELWGPSPVVPEPIRPSG